MTLTSFLGMMQSLPYLMKLGLDINIIVHSYYASWDVNLIPAGLHFNNLFGLKRLGTLDSILLNRSAIFNNKKRVV